jgi:cytochrome c5
MRQAILMTNLDKGLWYIVQADLVYILDRGEFMMVRRSFCMTLVCLTISSITMAAEHSSAAPSGQEVFEASCANCHDSFIGGFFSGAPALGDKADWEALIPKGIDGLTGTTIAGIGGMEERGGCADCSDEEIRAAVEYILEQSQ